jgi:hypothetical protein
MVQPAPYTRKFNFTNAQAANPAGQTPGISLDSEFNAVKVVLDAIEARLPLIQRDDGNLANDSVTVDQLSPSLSMGFTLRGVWAVGINYDTGDGVSVGTVFYRCLAANLSSVSNGPSVSTATWQEVADLASIAGTLLHAANAAADGTAAAPGIGFQSEATGFFKQAAGVIGVAISGVQQLLVSTLGILLPQDPPSALYAATKQYVDAAKAAAIATAEAVAAAALTASHVGVVDGSNAAAGQIGEVISSSVLASATAMTTTAPVDITSIILTPGDWDVWGNIVTSPAGTTTTSYLEGSISTTGPEDATAELALQVSGSAGIPLAYPLPYKRVNITSGATAYLVGRVDFAIAAMHAGGSIYARRAR